MAAQNIFTHKRHIRTEEIELTTFSRAQQHSKRGGHDFDMRAKDTWR